MAPNETNALVNALLAKLPAFDLLWSDQIKAAWFEALRGLLDIQRETKVRIPDSAPATLLARMAEALKLAAEYGLWANHLADQTSRDAREAAEQKISEALAEYEAGKEKS